MKPEEKAAKRCADKFLKATDWGYWELAVNAFLAGVKWERKQVLKEKLDKWDGKNLKKEAKKDGN